MRETGGRRVRIGIVGTGVISQLMHLPMLAERTDVELIGGGRPG